MIPALADAAEPLLQHLEALAADTPPDPVLPAHRAFRPAQVLIHQGRVGFIDFDGFGQSEPALDLSRFLRKTRALGLDAAKVDPNSPAGLERLAQMEAIGEAFLSAYEAHVPVSRQRIALWEALSGERPYRGPTLDDLRTQVARGPTALDASRIPRRLRATLCRGLDPDPARRWPTMNALLARLVRAERRPGLALAIAGGAAVAAAVAFVALRGGAPAPACPAPARDPATVWSPAIAAELRVASESHAAALDAAFDEWRAARTEACRAPPQVQPAQLQCLDGVLGRLDALRQGYGNAPMTEDMRAELVDPAICRKPAAADVPRLALAATPDVVAAYRLYARTRGDHKPSYDEIAALAGKPTADPCARVIAGFAFDAVTPDMARARALMKESENFVEQCGDDRLRAELSVAAIQYNAERPIIGSNGEAAIQKAQLAVKRVAQPDLEARLALQQMQATIQLGRWEELSRLGDAAIAGYGARGLAVRQLEAVTRRITIHFVRAEPRDLEAIAADAEKWRAAAEAAHQPEIVYALDFQGAIARYRSGKVTSEHANIVRLWLEYARHHRSTDTRKIDGVVVDTRGRPVAGATVMSARFMGADAVGFGVFVGDPDGTFRVATTDEQGRFAIDDATSGVIAAQLGELRSKGRAIADHVRLKLEPTRRVMGRVELAGLPPGRVFVLCQGVDAKIPTIATVNSDGSFVLDGASVGAIRVGTMLLGANGPQDISFHDRPASLAPATGLELTVRQSTRVLDVIVHSAVAAALPSAEVVLMTGKPPPRAIKTVGELRKHHWTGSQRYFAKHVAADELSEAVRGRLRADDLAVHIEHAPAGELTVCAIAGGGDLADPAVRRRLEDHDAERTLACERIGPDAGHAVVEAPPQRRFD